MFGLTTRRYNNLLGFDPFRDMEEMERRFFAPSNQAFGFRTDILEEDGGYKLQADLPGFEKEDIHVDLEGDMLTISAERKEENEENRDGYVRRERRFGSYRRSFDVSEIDQDAIAGDYTNGVLTLHLPKKEAEAPAAKRIELS